MAEVSIAPRDRPVSPRKRKSGVVIPHKARPLQRLLARLAYSLVWCVSLTVRYKLHDGSELFKDVPREKFVFAIWHNRLALSLMIYRRFLSAASSERKLAAMVSASRDGGLLTRILELFGVQPVRGSSSRRGPQALREMVSWAESGYDLAITPDGPRGPCYHVQEGVISTSQLTGFAILPVSYHLNWKLRPGSWDRFQIPLPFATCDVFVGKPIVVPREASDEEREALRQELERSLQSLTRD